MNSSAARWKNKAAVCRFYQAKNWVTKRIQKGINNRFRPIRFSRSACWPIRFQKKKPSRKSIFALLFTCHNFPNRSIFHKELFLARNLRLHPFLGFSFSLLFKLKSTTTTMLQKHYSSAVKATVISIKPCLSKSLPLLGALSLIGVLLSSSCSSSFSVKLAFSRLIVDLLEGSVKGDLNSKVDFRIKIIQKITTTTFWQRHK